MLTLMVRAISQQLLATKFVMAVDGNDFFVKLGVFV